MQVHMRSSGGRGVGDVVMIGIARIQRLLAVSNTMKITNEYSIVRYNVMGLYIATETSLDFIS